LSVSGVRRPAQPTREERQAATRAALLRAASRSICELGMDGASIDYIAAQAGFTKGAFYANFASKEELFLVMLEEKFTAELERLEAALASSGEPAEGARRASAEFLAYVDRDPEWPRLYQEFAAHAARNEDFRREFAERQRMLRARMAHVFERWASTFGIQPVLPHADVAAMTFFMADGFLLNRIIDPELDDRLYVTMCEVFLCGLGALAEQAESADEPNGQGLVADVPQPTRATPRRRERGA
jgi:AcrR family transcriptional regulator